MRTETYLQGTILSRPIVICLIIIEASIIIICAFIVHPLQKVYKCITIVSEKNSKSEVRHSEKLTRAP